MRKIVSLQNSLVKHLVHLRGEKTYRHRSGRVIVSGVKLISELAAHYSFRTLLIEEGLLPPPSYKADEVFEVSKSILKKITGLKNPEPIAAEIDMPKSADLSSARFLLILDGISDPGNLGTLLRTALALGWDGVFLTEGSADPFNEKALRAAKGATFKLPLKSGSRQELNTLLHTKPFTLLAAHAQGKDLKKWQPSSCALALILGNESHGVHPELKERSEMIAIPMSSLMESLNVATAGAILMYALKKGDHE